MGCKTYKVQCLHCGLKFERKVTNCSSSVYQKKKYKKGSSPSGKEFCSVKCHGAHRNLQVLHKCKWCNTDVWKTQAELKKSKTQNTFCSRSCSVSFNNTLKRKSRRSKCEKLLFDMLAERYPNLNLFPNDKNLLNGLEVDIAIPSLSMAIEWNGIVHYQPIYGVEKLEKIKNMDFKKQIIAQKSNIELIVVPDLVSSEKYVKEAFQNICLIINQKM